MTQAIVASFPVTSPFLPTFLENIIDKKISGVALNLLEKLMDWICFRVCCPYMAVYRGKMARVHTFSDGETRLFDTTKEKVAKIESAWENDYITLRNNKVFFNRNPNIGILFSRQAFTDYVVIKDDERRRGGVFQIIEQEIPRPGNPRPMEKSWHVKLENRVPGGILVERPR